MHIFNYGLDYFISLSYLLCIGNLVTQLLIGAYFSPLLCYPSFLEKSQLFGDFGASGMVKG